MFPICPVHFMSTFNAFPLFLTLSCIICFIISFASIFYTYDALCFYKIDEPQFTSNQIVKLILLHFNNKINIQ